MSETRNSRFLAVAFAGILLLAAGCSHAVFPQSGGTGTSSDGLVILTLHDTPASGAPSGVTVTSFEVTITGVVLEPGNVSLLTNGQTVELTQLQTNSVYLNTASSVPPGAYTSLQITYSSPQYTIVNSNSTSVTEPSGQCAANAACVVTPTTTTLTNTVNLSSLNISAGTPTLLEFDINLNNVIQSDYSVNFSQSGGVAVTTGTSTVSTIDTFNLAGTVQSIDADSNQFQLLASTGQTFNITSTTNTVFEFGRLGCMINNFTCINTGQILDVVVNMQSDGQTFDAAEVDYDDAENTQQVSGTIVSESGNPPTSLQMVVHNTIPAQSSLPPGTPVTVNISNSASYFTNNGSFVLSGLNVSFASTSDLMAGQEVEARVASNSSITNGSFTSDRLALEQTQLQAAISEVEAQAQPYPYFELEPLPPLFTNEMAELQVFDTSSNQNAPIPYQNISTASMAGLSVGQSITVGGFLFNSGPPSMIVTVVRAPQNP
jgi:hypothetical protein